MCRSAYGAGAFAENLRDVIHMSGLKMTVGQIVIGSACLALVGYILAVMWIPSVLLGLAAGLLMGTAVASIGMSGLCASLISSL